MIFIHTTFNICLYFEKEDENKAKAAAALFISLLVKINQTRRVYSPGWMDERNISIIIHLLPTRDNCSSCILNSALFTLINVNHPKFNAC